MGPARSALVHTRDFVKTTNRTEKKRDSRENDNERGNDAENDEKQINGDFVG